jgi:hypothetical protein
MSRGAVEGAATISGRFARPISTAAPRAHFAGSRACVLHAALWYHHVTCKCWRHFYRRTKCAPRRARRSSQTPRAAPTPPQSSCRCLGGHVRNRCSLCTLPHSHIIPGTACGRVGAVLAQDWRSARRSFTPCALRMHPKAGTTSHGRNQRAVSTTCRTGGMPFVPNVANTEPCRVAPRLRQYLAWGVRFWRRTGTAPPPVLAENAQCLCSSLAPLCQRCWMPITALRAIAPGGHSFGGNAPRYPAQHACNSPPGRRRGVPSVCDPN